MATVTLSRSLVLASASPRRAALLAQIGLAARIIPAHIEEPPPAIGDDLHDWLCRTATAKARATAALLPPDACLILGADTVVALSGKAAGPCRQGQPVRLLGKPTDVDDARRMLRSLSGRTHDVLSAFAVLCHPEGTVISEVATTHVVFRSLAAEEIETYLATGEPLDKAGAYGIQGRGAVLVDRIEGDYYTVVGLPLARLWACLAPWRVSYTPR